MELKVNFFLENERVDPTELIILNQDVTKLINDIVEARSK